MSTSTKLKIENITSGYDGKIIIKDINLSLEEGKTVSILGQSGIGKSTLLNVIAGLLKPYEGKIILNGEDITNTTGHISYMLQKDLLLPFKTISQNIMLPLIIKGINKKKAREKVDSYLDEFGLRGYEDKYPASLSGGMKQRASLLRSYLFQAEIMLLDEPFSALDYFTKYKMHKWYIDIKDKLNLSTIFITHDIDEALKLSDNIYIMKGSPATLTGPILDKENDSKYDEKLIKNNIMKILEIE